MSLNEFSDVLASSVVLAFLYVLVGLAWVVIFRTTGVMNFANGQMLTFGAFIAYNITATWGLPFAAGVIGGVLSVALLGVLSYNACLRPIAGQPAFAQIIMTFGISIVISGVIPIIWGTIPLNLEGPVENDRLVDLPLSAFFTTYGVATIVVGAVCFGGTILFLRKVRIGTQMEAAAERPLLASQTGLNISRLFSGGWAMALVPAGFGGISVALTSALSTGMADLGLRALAPAIIGGLDSVTGLIIGAFIVALVESIAVSYLGAEAQNAAVFTLLLVFLAIRPYGLFGRADVRRV
jgi:branched-chain amino acid transport system permease protein